jgi:nucleotide-binding universal stress UspA family protein
VELGTLLKKLNNSGSPAMTYKTILVCLNSIQAVPQLTSAARDLGAKFGAHVRALYVIPGVEVYSGAAMVGGFQFYDEIRRYYEKHQAEVKNSFSEAMRKDGLNFDFEIVDAASPDSASDFMLHSRTADLVVVSPQANQNFPGVEPDFVERMVIGVGRPLLILPKDKKAVAFNDEVLLAWNDSRESARAAFDAIPFMQTAKRTRIATIGLHRGMVLGATIAETLDRHKVKAETVNLSLDGMGEGEVLLRAAKDYGSGLLVMGCYGHSRFAEFVFGGASRHILKNLNLPVLMSH